MVCHGVVKNREKRKHAIPKWEPHPGAQLKSSHPKKIGGYLIQILTGSDRGSFQNTDNSTYGMKDIASITSRLDV